MAQSDLNVANWALRLIGHRAVLTALADTTTEGLACNAIIDDVRKSLLRMHPWNFAIKRKKILPYQNIAVSNVTFVSSELIEVTHSSLTLAAGNYVTLSGIEGATGANGVWEVASVPTPGTVVRLTAIDVTTSDLLGTYTASATDYIRRSPAFDYSYLYTLPSDNLRVLYINEEEFSPRWRIEAGQILADETTLRIRYIYDVTDYTTMDVTFYNALAHYLGYHLCDHLSASDEKKNELHMYLYGGQGKKGILQQARYLDSVEDSTQVIEADDWTLSRFGASADLSRLG